MSRQLAGYARSGAWSIAAHATQLVGALILSIIVVRALSREQFGWLSLGRQFAMTAVLLSGFALERVILRFIPEIYDAGGGTATVRFFWKTLAVRVVGWIPWMLLVLWGGGLLESAFDAPLRRTAVVAVATALAFGVHNHVRAAATARFATFEVARASAVTALFTLGATAWALARGHGVDAILTIAGLGVLVGTALMFPAVLRRDAGAPAPSGAPGFSLRSRRFLDYALPFGGIAVLNYVVHSQTEVYFLGYFHGAELAGLFHHGFTFAQRFIDFLPLALWEVSMAGFSQIAVREPERLSGALRIYLTLLYLAMAPLALLGVAFSGSAIFLLYGAKMMPSVVVSQGYFLMAAVAALGAPIGMILYARERVSAALRAYVVFAIVNVGLDLLLIPSMALWGGILALAAAKFTSVVLMSWLVWKEIGSLAVPWEFVGRVFAASTPVLAWLFVDEHWTQPWQIALGALGAVVVLVLSFRALRVVGRTEAQWIAQTRLPLRTPLLRLLGHSPELLRVEV